MSFDIGFNCRATSGFVTDGAGETYFLFDSYPTTRAGVTFGAEDGGLEVRDRVSGNDRRLAGCVRSAGSNRMLRIDLPAAGTYDVYLAMGDPSFSSADYGADFDLRIRDNVTELLQVTGATTSGGFLDASGVNRTAAAWPGSNAKVTLTFSSTILRVYAPFADGRAMLAHIRVTDAAGGGATIVPQHYYPHLLGGIGGPF